jgi:hypothetical protein
MAVHRKKSLLHRLGRAALAEERRANLINRHYPMGHSNLKLDRAAVSIDDGINSGTEAPSMHGGVSLIQHLPVQWLNPSVKVRGNRCIIVLYWKH